VLEEESPQRLAIFENLLVIVKKKWYFRRAPGKNLLKNFKKNFLWGGGGP